MKAKTPFTKKLRKKYPLKSRDIPVTKVMLYGVRNELKSGLTSARLATKALARDMKNEFVKVHGETTHLRKEMKTEFAEVREEMKTEFAEVRGEISEVRGEIAQLRGEITDVRGETRSFREEMKHDFASLEFRLRADILDVKSEVQRLATLVEEQHSQNIYTLDAVAVGMARQDDHERRIRNLEDLRTFLRQRGK